MEIQRQNGTLSVSGLRDLNVANAHHFRNEVGAAIAPDLERIEIDLSALDRMDCSGVGALLSLYQAANKINRNGGVSLRVLNPQAPVRQMFELTRMHQVFEIVPANGDGMINR
jgi:anti-sigma B factor antagonist